MPADLVATITQLCIQLVVRAGVRYSDVIDVLISILVDDKTLDSNIEVDDVARLIGKLESLRVKKGGASVEE